MTTEKTTNAISPDSAKRLVDMVGPSLGYDFTYAPAFPKDKKDVCVVIRAVENGRDYGFSIAYLVWMDEAGNLQHTELMNTRRTKDYINLEYSTAPAVSAVIPGIKHSG
jgi:hypothetical protein